MHLRFRAWTLSAAALLFGLSLWTARPAAAQSEPSAPPGGTGPGGMAIQDWQGLSCLWVGAVGGASVFYFSDVLTVAATGVTNPLLLVPLIATGVLGGCSFGANAAPGLTWLYRHL